MMSLLGQTCDLIAVSTAKRITSGFHPEYVIRTFAFSMVQSNAICLLWMARECFSESGLVLSVQQVEHSTQNLTPA